MFSVSGVKEYHASFLYHLYILGYRTVLIGRRDEMEVSGAGRLAGWVWLGVMGMQVLFPIRVYRQLDMDLIETLYGQVVVSMQEL